MYDMSRQSPMHAEAYDASSSSLAAACCGLSLAWAVVAYTLGLRFDSSLHRATDGPARSRPGAQAPQAAP